MKKLPPRYEKFRHYTIEIAAKSIWLENEIRTLRGWFEGDLWVPGIYITDISIEPISEYFRTQIATILRIPREGPPDPNRVTAYVEMLIDRNRIGLIYMPFIYPHQYLYPGTVLWNDGVKVKFVKVGP